MTLKTSHLVTGQRLTYSFFNRPTVRIAKELLGKYLIVKRNGKTKIGQIIETEAYVGPNDKASHASRGRTPRTEIMFGPPGKLYVYLIYGMYYCLNIVTEEENYPAAVLIRGLKPVLGIRGKTDGPGKLCRELNITNNENGLDIVKSQEIYIINIGTKPKKIISGPRVGITYAGGWIKKNWRFIMV